MALTACFGDDSPRVTTSTVSSGQVTQSVSAPARVQALARQDVAAAVSGVIVALAADDGARVREGETVVRLQSGQVELAKDQAQAAEQAAATAGGVAVDGGGGQTLAAVRSVVAQLDRTIKPRLTNARRRLREAPRGQERAAARVAVDAVETSYLSTRAALLASASAIAAQQDSTAAAVASALNQATASATAAQRAQTAAAAQAAARQSEGLVVTTPFSGVVQFGQAAAANGGGPAEGTGLPGELSGVAGQLRGLAGGSGSGTLRVGAPVTAGQTLFTVYDLSDRYVDADIDEVDAPAVRPGQRATVLVDAVPETTFEGVVESVAVEAATTEAGGVGYPARVRLLGPAEDAPAAQDGTEGHGLRALRVGMTASAEIATATVDAALVVPSRALLRRDSGSIVWVVRDGRARQVAVTVQALGEEQAAVTGELRPDDQVVVAGYEDLTDGLAVQDS